MTDRDNLLAEIKSKAIVHGKVTLSSGQEADFYLDLRRITLDGVAAPLVGSVMLDLTADLDYEAVGGLTMGADPVAVAMLHAAAARGRSLDAFVVRKAQKAHGMQRRIEGPPLHPHGGHFEYRSTLTCLLGMLAERASGLRLPELISRHLWQGLGAEHDAEITVDRNGNALADIGVSCTVRDLARLGQVLLAGGARPDGTRVVPDGWVADTLVPDPGQADAFAPHGTPYLAVPGAYYRNQWWVAGPRRAGRDGVYLALGIHGQLLYVDEAAGVVVAKFSSWPEPWIDDLARDTVAGCASIVRALADTP
ncbi:serine hydrolase [Nonomuraea sp. NPDC004297]